MNRTLTRLAALALTLAVALSAATPAQAVTHPYAGPTLAQSYAIALAAWPDSPCAGGFTITKRVLTGVQGVEIAEAADGAVEQSDGTLRTVECKIALDPNVAENAARTCDLIVHGAGHLAGHLHAEGGIMRAGAGTWPACHATTARQDAISLVFDALPRDTRVWNVTCAITLTRCKARSAGATVRRYAVTLDSITRL